MRIIYASALLLFLGAGAYAGWSYFSDSSRHAILSIGWHGSRYSVEIADTPELWSRGLGERDSLCPACSMLFIFPRAEKYGFWMKGMRFPLDIIWVSEEKVVHIERNISPTSRETFRPDVAADQVIEVNAGSADQLKEGDRIDYYDK